ncbi:hypothetical protein ACFE04_024951 [Oxalis oulophora]
MKNKASEILKKIASLLSSIAKAKAIADIKSKTHAAKARLIMFALVRSKKVNYLGSISNKIHNLLQLGHHDHEKDEGELEEDERKAIVLYNAMAANESTSSSHANVRIQNMVYYDYDDDDDDNDDDKYPDLRHCLFDEDELNEFDGDKGGSVIDMVKHSKEEEGEDFKLEDEIDHVADLFIQKFHKQIRMQKLLSFKKYQEMLNRGV